MHTSQLKDNSAPFLTVQRQPTYRCSRYFFTCLIQAPLPSPVLHTNNAAIKDRSSNAVNPGLQGNCPIPSVLMMCSPIRSSSEQTFQFSVLLKILALFLAENTKPRNPTQYTPQFSRQHNSVPLLPVQWLPAYRYFSNYFSQPSSSCTNNVANKIQSPTPHT